MSDRYRKATKAELIRELERLEQHQASQTDVESLRHELQTHKLETDVRAQELLESNVLLEDSRRRYVDLFDFAPIGYLGLDSNGVVEDINMAAATLLDVERSRIIGFPFLAYVDRPERRSFLDHMRRCRKLDGDILSELHLRARSGKIIAVQLSSRRAADEPFPGPLFRTAVIDLTEQKEAEAIRSRLMQLLLTAEEEERKRLSRELHDQLGQQVTALALGLGQLAARVQDPDSTALIARLRGLVDQIGRDAHQVAVTLRPTALDDVGLHAAVTNLVENWSHSTGISVDLHSAGLESRRVPPEIASTAYRIIQEALNNVAKHACARSVSVLLEYRDRTLIVSVEDDGVGFDIDAQRQKASREGRLGLLGMRERAALLGGTLDIESSPGQGTSLLLKFQTAARSR